MKRDPQSHFGRGFAAPPPDASGGSMPKCSISVRNTQEVSIGYNMRLRIVFIIDEQRKARRWRARHGYLQRNRSSQWRLGIDG